MAPVAPVEQQCPRQVVVLRNRRGSAHGHEATTLETMARRIAALVGGVYAGEYAPSASHEAPLFFVPADTLLDDQAASLGVRTIDDLFGGVVPYPFVATKTVAHPALTPRSRVPEGWSSALAGRVGDAVLPGFSVFTADDAYQACDRLFPLGPARLKPALGIGGSGQFVVATRADLDAALEQIDPEELHKYGLAIELNLDDVTTFSIGQAELGGIRITYHGTQRLTPNRNGAMVYGGSDLHVVRGCFPALLALDLPPGLRTAVTRAQCFDAVLSSTFPRFFASRRNYDVIQGRDRDGLQRTGVLEQSWRIGGASPAEIAAIQAFKADPGLQRVHAATHEVYALQPAPEGAEVHFSGVDPHVGPLTKYSRVEADGNQA